MGVDAGEAFGGLQQFINLGFVPILMTTPSKLNLEDVSRYVENNIGEFHAKRLDRVNNIKLKEVLRKKNPYLFKAKNVTTASEIVDGILTAFISSSEEGKFGNWMERLAIYINDSVYKGGKSAGPGTDLDFVRDGQRYIVAVKSGPNWANEDQQLKLSDQFNSIRKRLNTSGSRVQVVCVNGCCYGRSNPKYEYKQKFNYFKICGQRFWELISGDNDLYKKLIIPLGHQAEEKNREYQESYGTLVNRFTKEFLEDFCDKDGAIDWDKLIIFNSAATAEESPELIDGTEPEAKVKSQPKRIKSISPVKTSKKSPSKKKSSSSAVKVSRAKTVKRKRS